MSDNFKLIEGISVPSVSGIKQSYHRDDENKSIFALLSADKFYSVLKGAVGLMEDMFFFLEVPLSENEEKALRKSDKDPFHLAVYYLDVTKEVALAILKRYGDILINDGVSRFGFGSHKDKSEIYVLPYQEISVFSEKTQAFAELFDWAGAGECETFKTLWDTFSDKNPGEAVLVEIDGETVYDVVENLTEVGLYKADIVKE